MKLSTRLNKKRIFTAMIILAVVSSIFGRRLGEPLSSTLQYALIPLGEFGHSGAASIRQAFSVEHDGLSAAQADQLSKELEDLQNKIQILQKQRDYWYVQSLRIQKIREAFAPIRETCELIPARVVLSPTMPYSKEAAIDAGAIKKVGEGMEVVEIMTDRSKALQDWNVISANASGMVGRIVASGKLASRVMLVTDKHFSERAQIYRVVNPQQPRQVIINTANGPVERALTADVSYHQMIDVKVSGEGNNSLVVEDVPRHHNVLPGDIILTNPNSPIMPVQLRIATVTEVTQSQKYPNFVNLKARPIVNIDSLREVFVVRPLATLPPAREGVSR